ncbi:putative selenium-dependent hydroxylase accessory protein YqeC, partial [bacterium]|nr:putative selenium-dependent hydroxylase accessory protein YqeC [bacterium]
ILTHARMSISPILFPIRPWQSAAECWKPSSPGRSCARSWAGEVVTMRLLEGLRADDHSRIAFVGAGGKTTAMFSLARQYQGPVICLNTAHLAVDQARLADKHRVVTDPSLVESFLTPESSGILLLTGPTDGRGRLLGLAESITVEICKTADRLSLPVLVEADGSRLRPLKAPAAHEPPIPSWVNQVVVTVGLSGIGSLLNEETVFRPEIFSALSGAKIGEEITLEHLKSLVLDPQGGMKNIPLKAHKTLLVNQIDEWNGSESELDSMLQSCLPTFDTVLSGNVQQLPDNQIVKRHETVGGVILAAGGSLRMGDIKQLLPWRGKPLVRHVAESALKVGLNPVVVVTGAAAEKVQAALEGLPVVCIKNETWETGQASSVRVGIQTLPDACGAAVFLLSDMPQVPPELIQAELALHAQHPEPIIVPRVNGQRTNPVLFDKVTFNDLNGLTGDTGGRALFDLYPQKWLDWDAKSPLGDIDTPADYQRLVE